MITRRRLTGCLFVILFTACRENASQVVATQAAQRVTHAKCCVDSARSLIRDGDLITRTGIDFTSQSLRQFCRTDNTYSHCGIISIEQGQIMVYHALGGEINPDQKLKREPLSSFCDGLDNLGFGLFRFPLTPVYKKALHRQLQTQYAAGLPFDMAFNLQTDTAMYCTEFVYKMLEQATNHTLQFASSRVSGLEYMAADHIFLHDSCREIHRFVY